MSERKIKENKIEGVKNIRSEMDSSKIIIITDHSGLKVVQMTQLRRKLWDVDAQYQVIKNTLASIALKGEEEEKIKNVLNGPTSMIFGKGDIVSPAKIISSFIKENEKPSIKGAFMEGRFLEPADVKKIASLPSKEILLSQMLASMNSPITSFVRVIQGPIRKLVYALEEIRKKRG